MMWQWFMQALQRCMGMVITDFVNQWNVRIPRTCTLGPNTSLIKGGIEMAALGTGIALIGYGIGTELASIGIINV